MSRFLFHFFYLKTFLIIQRYNIKVKRSIFIDQILRNTFPVKFYHFSLVNWTAATESATSYEYAHCTWYAMLIIKTTVYFSILTGIMNGSVMYRSKAALLVVWPEALPLTDSCLSSLPAFEYRPWQVRKLQMTFGKAVVFVRYSGFLHHLQLTSYD